MKKFLLVVVIGILLLPLVMTLLPKPLTIEKAEEGLRAAGLNLTEVTPVTPPQLRAIEQVSLKIDGAPANLYRYDNPIALQNDLQAQRPSSGSVIAEQMGIAAMIPAQTARSTELDIGASDNELLMLVVTTPNRDLRQRIVDAFANL